MGTQTTSRKKRNFFYAKTKRDHELPWEIVGKR
jgi:hypothetical protein